MNNPGCFGLFAQRSAPAIVILLVAFMLLSGCNELKAWRDGQIRESHALAGVGLIVLPDPPITVPSKVSNQLPWDDGFVVVSFTEDRGVVNLTALAPGGTMDTTNWMIGRLAEMGYDSGDNVSRVLEGVEYSKDGAVYSKLFVKVTMNTHDQCIVEMHGSN